MKHKIEIKMHEAYNRKANANRPIKNALPWYPTRTFGVNAWGHLLQLWKATESDGAEREAWLKVEPIRT